MRMKKVFTLYADGGHAWAKVPRKLLEQLGILKDITHYSYQRGDYVYLEEDGDLSTFLVAYPIATFYERDSYHSRIRRYDNFKA